MRAELSGAVIIQPLSRAQVSTYLKQAGKALAGVRTVLRDDETLWELLETPLMLSIVALAYQGRSATEVRATGSLEQRRTHLFENYTQRMFERRTKVTEYTPDQIIRWLTWLARSLIHNNLSVFYVEWMQPDWLPSRVQRWIVAIMPFIVVALVIGLLFGLLFGLGSGLVIGLGRGFDSKPGGGVSSRIMPVEGLRWSWRKARNCWAGALVTGLGVGLVTGLGSGLFYGLGVGLVTALLFGLVGGLTAEQMVTRTIPNEGIRRSLRNALISFLTVGLVVGLLFGLVIGMCYGGLAYLMHYVLRFLLWRNDYAPLNYIRFLDHAAERVFLRKVGGGYIFTHRLLMEYFAALQPTDQARQTKTA